jgi:hypothetical protein
METYEKDILKKEITTEVREDIARATGKLITRRILLALAIIGLETLIWLLITTSVMSGGKGFNGISASYFVMCLRIGQVGAYQWFKAE